MSDDQSTSVSRRRFLVASGAASALAVAGCTENPAASGDDGGTPGTSTDKPLSGSIDIAGSSTVFPLATAMSERFRQEYQEVRFNIQSTGSGGGFANHFCPGRTDFNNASRPIQPEEQQTCADNGVEPVELKVATDALTVVVNNEAEWVDCLTTDQLQEIWSAESRPETWADIDSTWPDEPFELFGPTDASGTYDYFIEAVLGEDGPGHRQDYSATEQDRTIIQGVEGNQHAIGYLGFAYYSTNTERVKAVGIDDGDGCVEPSLETAKSGDYTPLARPLFTYPKATALADDHVAEFARFWMERSDSREIVADEVGYVPLGPDEKTAQQDRLETAIEEAN